MKINLLDIPVIFINLDKDKDKRKAVESMLKAAGFKTIIRFPGYEIKTPKLGCATSHNAVLQKLISKKMPVLVLEDDVIITEDFEPEIEVPEDADAVYLGISRFGLYNNIGTSGKVAAERYDDKLYRIYNMLAAHAILYLNNEYPEFLKRATDFMISIQDNQDKARASTMKFFNVYAFSLPFFHQGNYNVRATKFDLSKLRLLGKHQSL